MKPTFRIYAAGGCGSNILQKYVDIPNGPGFPESISSVMIDTSDANRAPNSTCDFYRIPGVQGAGSDRSLTYNAVNASINDILNEHKPGLLNVVISSAAGGSGSVIGPMVTNELLARGELVVYVLVGATDTLRRAENANNTFLTLKNIAGQQNKVLPLIYYHLIGAGELRDSFPSEDDMAFPMMNRTDTDESIGGMISDLAMLAAQTQSHGELDLKDLTNFINYNNVTPVKPGLVQLFISENSGYKREFLDGNTISTISLMTSTQGERPEYNQPYVAEGYFNDATQKTTDNLHDIHYLISAAHVNGISALLNQAVVAAKNNAEKLSADTEVVIPEGAKGTSEGMII